jgi:putative PIN family toxin of toxin-antitoxin system
MRVVLDTSVLVSGLRSASGASAAVLSLVSRRRIVPLVTASLMIEYEAVLKRPEHAARLAAGENSVDRFLDELSVYLEPVDVVFRWRPTLRDANDEHVFEAAVNGRASALATHNVRDFKSVAPRFGIEILTPAELLERFRA